MAYNRVNRCDGQRVFAQLYPGGEDRRVRTWFNLQDSVFLQKHGFGNYFKYSCCLVYICYEHSIVVDNYI